MFSDVTVVVSSDDVNIAPCRCNVNGYIKNFSKKFPGAVKHLDLKFNIQLGQQI